jgi:hypothetical protein
MDKYNDFAKKNILSPIHNDLVVLNHRHLIWIGVVQYWQLTGFADFKQSKLKALPPKKKWP